MLPVLGIIIAKVRKVRLEPRLPRIASPHVALSAHIPTTHITSAHVSTPHISTPHVSRAHITASHITASHVSTSNVSTSNVSTSHRCPAHASTHVSTHILVSAHIALGPTRLSTTPHLLTTLGTAAAAGAETLTSLRVTHVYVPLPVGVALNFYVIAHGVADS